MAAPTTTTSGRRTETARYGASGLKETQATTRKKQLAARRNCSNSDLGTKLAAVYLVVEIAFPGYAPPPPSSEEDEDEEEEDEHPAPLQRTARVNPGAEENVEVSVDAGAVAAAEASSTRGRSSAAEAAGGRMADEAEEEGDLGVERGLAVGVVDWRATAGEGKGRDGERESGAVVVVVVGVMRSGGGEELREERAPLSVSSPRRTRRAGRNGQRRTPRPRWKARGRDVGPAPHVATRWRILGVAWRTCVLIKVILYRRIVSQYRDF